MTGHIYCIIALTNTLFTKVGHKIFLFHLMCSFLKFHFRMNEDLSGCALSRSITDDSYFSIQWSMSTGFDRRI